jgi:coenzyme PQQ precursor peptide PqqA
VFRTAALRAFSQFDPHFQGFALRASRRDMRKFDTIRVRRIAAHQVSGVQFIPPVAPTMHQPRFPALPGVSALPDVRPTIHFSRSSAMWTKPAYTDLRFGFEITMYISNR